MERGHIFILGLVGGLGVASSDAYVSSLPFLKSLYSVSPELLNFTITAYFVSMALSCLLFSHIHSYVPAKKCYIAAILTFILASLFIALYPSEEMLITGRIIQGFSFGIIQPLIISHIRTVGKDENLGKNMSMYSFAAEIVSTCTPIVGALLFSFLTWNSPFLFISCLTAFLFYLSYGLISEKEKIGYRESTIRSMTEILKDRGFIRYNFLSFFMIGLAWALITISSYEINNPIVHGICYSAFCGLYGLGNLIHERGYISDQKFLRFFPFLIIMIGIVIIAGFFLESKILVILPFVLFGLLSGLFYGISVERSFMGILKKDTSHASSLFSFSRLISSAIFIQLSAFLYFNLKMGFLLLIAGTCLSIALLLGTYRVYGLQMNNSECEKNEDVA